MSYTEDDLMRLNAEIERVEKLKWSTRKHDNHEYTKWRKRQDEIEAELKARKEAWEAERPEREAREAAEMAEWRELNAKQYKIRQRAEVTRLLHLEERTPEVMQRIRRSRVDWSDIIDDPLIAERQEKWERRRTALVMSEAGMTCAEIGKRLSVSLGRAQQLVQKALREAGEMSPAELYVNNSERAVATALAIDGIRTVPQVWPALKDEDTWIWMGLAA